MSKENRCAACGKAFSGTASPVIDGDHVFCDKICRANFRKGKTSAPPPPIATTPNPRPENNDKYIGRFIEGGASIMLGLLLTWWSKDHAFLKGYYAIFYGPVVWGVIVIIWGTIIWWESKKPSASSGKAGR